MSAPATPSSELTNGLVGQQRRGVGGVHDPPGVDHDRGIGDPPDQRQVLLHQQHGGPLGDPGQHVADLGDQLGRQTLGRFVDQQQPRRPEQHPGQRDHLLLPAGQRAGPLLSPFVQFREQFVHGVVVRLHARAPRPVSGSPPRSATANTSRSSGTYPTPDRTIRWVGVPSIRRRRTRSTRWTAPAQDRLEGGRLADAVAAEQRGHPALGDGEVDALQDV